MIKGEDITGNKSKHVLNRLVNISIASRLVRRSLVLSIKLYLTF